MTSSEPKAPAHAAPLSPVARPANGLLRRFTRGTEKPRGVVWFGLRSFWGHSRHFAASAIATEDIDSRDWMTPDDPQELVQRIAEVLGATRRASTLTESLGRDLWIDYLADTGDDVAVSRAVARLVFREYSLPDPRRAGEAIIAPRGDLLLFGGDTAYPVATAEEITTRVVAPFNQVLVDLPRDRPRVLLGIPGNHDWYDGLDGFGRMFRRRIDERAAGQRVTLRGHRRTMLGHYADWAREFVRGGHIEKPKALELIGYLPVQGASYFVLPVAPAVALLGVDRQLKEIDSRQKQFFQSWLSAHLAVLPWVLLPDPVYPFGHPSASAASMVKALGLTLRARPHFILSGDIHHYRREIEGPTLHVTAGGGGAFLHPAPLSRRKGRAPDVEWPDATQSRALLWNVPHKVALGRSGILPHIVLTALYAPLVAHLDDILTSAPTAGLVLAPSWLLICLVYALIGGIRRGNAATLVLAALVAVPTTVTPLAIGWLFRMVIGPAAYFETLVVAFIAAVVGALWFGTYLALLTLLGLENTQAFTALDHPGFKHFVRLRVRADGSAVDGWVIGAADPLGKRGEPTLVDTFTWKCR